jgi:Bacterial self-protective colicin-like immunity
VVADPWWEREKWAVDIAPYAILIRSFLEKRLTSREFQLLYFALFQSDTKHRPHEIFEVLDSLFADIDRYVYDDELRQHVEGFDESQLRERVRSAEKRLAIVGREHLS